MEFGQNCLDYLKSKSPLETVREIIVLAETLKELHGRNIAHRDIKPQNILAIDNRLCLADFGLVTYLYAINAYRTD